VNNSNVESPNPGCKPKQDTIHKLYISFWLVDWNVVPGPKKMLIEILVALGEISSAFKLS